ncbi:site-specific integrase [Rhodovulum sp. 12E13]|uniref:tyrosine-type recombinase/integrase n=1 Tax=Rhodovulum sp. 12E13 TaxID=2203891 RepID=UPI000E1A9531|nr:tyrosine-type recombinase/integrase [Rhodovulum sp. 12E13]RDC68045.1 site-specific integrase [Rhodovulum sp. 12E13]
MTLQSELQSYLRSTGLTARALSLSAGLHEKAVTDILGRPGHRPRRATLERLERATGLSLAHQVDFDPRTWQELIRDLERKREAGDRVAGRRAARVRWLVRKAGWVAETRSVCRHDAVDFFAVRRPAEVGLSRGSFATYKSDILAALSPAATRARKRSVDDIAGSLRELYDRIVESDLVDDLKRASGPILTWLHDQGLHPGDLTTDRLWAYHEYRREVAGKDEGACRKHVKRVASLWCALAGHPHFQGLGFRPIDHPFGDGRDRFGVPDAAIATLMEEWDTRVEPWARGLASRTGQTRAEFIAALDAAEAASETAVSDKKRRLRAKRDARRKTTRTGGESNTSRDDLLRAHGFLTAKDCWSDKTAQTRRAQIVALAKALYATADVAPDSLDELADPEILEAAAEALADANANAAYDSAYVSSAVKTVKKVAVGLLRCPDAQRDKIKELVGKFTPRRHGLAPRNKARLHQFTEDRIQATIDMSDELIRDVNAEIRRLRDASRKKHGRLPRARDVYDPRLARQVMAALAHDIMLKRGPRSANLIGIRLDWISWQADLATIVIPAAAVKGRAASDPDLPIPLGPRTSRLLARYLDGVREAALLPGDDQNPYLFPGQDDRSGALGRPYTGLLKRVVACVHDRVGVRINPHLYRHLIGWIWLKDNIEALPQVQRLLGHRSLQTTISYYAEIDDTLAFDSWQERIESKRTSGAEVMLAA